MVFLITIIIDESIINLYKLHAFIWKSKWFITMLVFWVKAPILSIFRSFVFHFTVNLSLLAYLCRISQVRRRYRQTVNSVFEEFANPSNPTYLYWQWNQNKWKHVCYECDVHFYSYVCFETCKTAIKQLLVLCQHTVTCVRFINGTFLLKLITRRVYTTRPLETLGAIHLLLLSFLSTQA